MALDVEVYHLDYGNKIELDCKTDVTVVLSRKMLIKNSAGIVTEVNCIQGSEDNYIRYIIPAIDSPIKAGQRYYIRAKVEFDAARKQQGDIVELIVGESWTVTP